MIARTGTAGAESTLNSTSNCLPVCAPTASACQIPIAASALWAAIVRMMKLLRYTSWSVGSRATLKVGSEHVTHENATLTWLSSFQLVPVTCQGVNSSMSTGSTCSVG